MNTHEAGRAKAAWRERNQGEQAPGDGQNVEPEPVEQPTEGLSTKNSPGLLGRARKT